jgi:hypothetical protein
MDCRPSLEHRLQCNPAFQPGQRRPRQLFEKLQGTKQLVAFTADEGADRDCEPLARSLLERRMFVWLDETVRRTPGSSDQ